MINLLIKLIWDTDLLILTDFISLSVQSIFTVPGVHLSKDPGYRSSAFHHQTGKSRRQSMLL